MSTLKNRITNVSYSRFLRLYKSLQRSVNRYNAPRIATTLRESLQRSVNRYNAPRIATTLRESLQRSANRYNAPRIATTLRESLLNQKTRTFYPIFHTWFFNNMASQVISSNIIFEKHREKCRQLLKKRFLMPYFVTQNEKKCSNSSKML